LIRYEIQLLSRQQDDYQRHQSVALGVGVRGELAFRHYYFAGKKSLVVLLELQEDVNLVTRALPRAALVSVRELETPQPVPPHAHTPAATLGDF